MASIEFIQKRIDSKKAEIEKLEKKMGRIMKAQESNYEEDNPYSYSDYDFRVTCKDLEDARVTLIDWQNKLKEENDKAASRNVPAIVEFLDKWEARTVDYYLDAYQRFTAAENEMKADYKEMSEQLKALGYRASWDKEDPNYEAYHSLEKEQRDMRKTFYNNWSYVTQFMGHEKSYEEYMKHMVAEEKKRKYDFIVERVCAIVGTITDASYLYVGDKGDLNGFIIGTNGRASVTTIGAGGWNVQVFHFRTLIHKMKEA